MITMHIAILRTDPAGESIGYRWMDIGLLIAAIAILVSGALLFFI
jgi:hypothetical protein